MDKDTAKRFLKRMIHKGSSVMTISTESGFHRSFGDLYKVRVFCIDLSSGMMRQKEITCEVAAACQYNNDIPFGDVGAIILDVGGFSPGFEVVRDLSWLLFQETYGLVHDDFR